MKKKMFLFSYASVLLVASSLQSCNDGPFTPNTGNGSGSGTDTTWVGDSTNNNGGSPIDSTGNSGGGNPTDTTTWNGGGNGGDTIVWTGGGNTPGDSTGWNPNDSTNIGG